MIIFFIFMADKKVLKRMEVTIQRNLPVGRLKT